MVREAEVLCVEGGEGGGGGGEGVKRLEGEARGVGDEGELDIAVVVNQHARGSCNVTTPPPPPALASTVSTTSDVCV